MEFNSAMKGHHTNKEIVFSVSHCFNMTYLSSTMTKVLYHTNVIYSLGANTYTDFMDKSNFKTPGLKMSITTIIDGY